MFMFSSSVGYAISVENEDEIETIHPPGLPQTLDAKPDLTSIVAKVIFQSSVMHAAVNFLQFEYGCFAPNVPALLKGSIPTEEDRGTIDVQRIMSTLPGRDTSLAQAGAAFVLSEFSEDEEFLLPTEGTHPPKFLFTEVSAKAAFDKFQNRLQLVEEFIICRNKTLTDQGDIPYEVLQPSRIPYGIAI